MLRDKYCLSEQRLANLKMSKVWAICEINIKGIYILDIKVEGIKYSYSLTQKYSSFGSLSASINGYRRHPSALHTCSSRGLQPIRFTCGLHPSSVDAPVDVHGPSCNFPFFHPREALLVGHRVIALPFFSCGDLSSSPPKEVVLHGVGLVHLSHV